MLAPMSSSTGDATPEQPRRPRRLWLGLLLSLGVLVIAGAVIASGRSGPSESGDQDKYHLPVIDTMVEQWPEVDIVNYRSATAPGYHAAMAWLHVTLGDGTGDVGMRVFNAALGSLIPFWCYVVARRFTSAVRALALSAPVALNSYLIGGSAYLTTDNAGLLFALLAVGLCVGWPASSARLGLAGLCAMLAVGIRQVHLWAAGAPALAGLLASPWWRSGGFGRFFAPWRTPARGVAPAAVGAIALGCGVGIVAWLAWLWGGLVPPAYAELHNSGANLAGLALAFALAGVIAPAYSLVATPLWRSDAYRSRSAMLGALVGLAASLVSPTTFQMKERALGWLWHGVWLTPDVGERSLLLTALAPIGGAAMGMLFSAATRHGRGPQAFVLASCVAVWMAAQTMNSMAWQRYYEPMLLVSVAWLAAMGSYTGRETIALERPRFKTFAMLERTWWLGPAALTAVQLVVTSVTFLREVLSADPVNF